MPGDYSADDGSADPGVVDLLTTYAVTPSDDLATRLVASVATARWLLPVVPRDGETATPVLTSRTGERAMPVFTSVAAMAAWDDRARQLPVSAHRAAEAAVEEDCVAILVDLGSAHAVVLRQTMLWALVEERPWLPAASDPVLGEGLAAQLTTYPEVLGYELSAGEPQGAGVLRLTLQVSDGMDGRALDSLAERVGSFMAADPVLRVRIDALDLRFERSARS